MLLKRIVCYVLVFLTIFTLSTVFLMASVAIPRSMIRENMSDSAEYLCKYPRTYNMIASIPSSERDLYADCITLNIAWNFQEDKPLASIMESKYYTSNQEFSEAFRSSVQENLPAETQYLRYWHGSSGVIRFLHLMMSLPQIYIVHALLLVILLFWLVRILIINEMHNEAAMLVIALGMVAIWFVPFCLEYTWVFLLMFLTAIVGLKLTIHGQYLYCGYLFLVAGMLTAYLDFLSTETLVLVVPLLLIIRVIERTKQTDDQHSLLRKIWQISIEAGLMWGIGFIGMWIGKWILASAVLQMNVMPLVSSHIVERIGGVRPVSSPILYVLDAVRRNIQLVFPLEFGIYGGIVVLLLVIVFFVRPTIQKRIEIRSSIRWRLVLLYGILGMIPIVRFMLLHNHSWYHQFFTYRALAGTLLALIFMVSEILTYLPRTKSETTVTKNG